MRCHKLEQQLCFGVFQVLFKWIFEDQKFAILKPIISSVWKQFANFRAPVSTYPKQAC